MAKKTETPLTTFLSSMGTASPKERVKAAWARLRARNLPIIVEKLAPDVAAKLGAAHDTTQEPEGLHCRKQN